MVWWQIIAIIAGSLAGGTLVGAVAFYVILRVQGRPWPFYPGWKREIVNNTPVPAISRVRQNTTGPSEGGGERGGTGEAVKPATSPDALREALNKLKSARSAERPAVKRSGADQPAAKKSEALLEAEANLETATAPWSDKLIPFQTAVWNSKQSEYDNVPIHLQQELVRAYADMRLANDIVWLATVLGRRSEELNTSYKGLCNRVAERLTIIIPVLRNSGGKTSE